MTTNPHLRNRAVRILSAPRANARQDVYNAVLDLRRNDAQPKDIDLLIPLLAYDDDMIVAAVLYSLTHVYGTVQDHRELVFRLSGGDPRDTGEMPIQVEAIECLAELAKSENSALHRLHEVAENDGIPECPRARAWQCLARIVGCEWKPGFTEAMVWDPNSERSDGIRANIRLALCSRIDLS